MKKALIGLALATAGFSAHANVLCEIITKSPRYDVASYVRSQTACVTTTQVGANLLKATSVIIVLTAITYLIEEQNKKNSQPKEIEGGEICPVMYLPSMPRRAMREGVSGKVRAEIKISNGSVEETNILSGPKVFHESVKEALRQYKCDPNIVATFTQEWTFDVN